MRRAVGSRLASIVVTCLSAAVAAEGTSSAGVVVAVSVVSVAGRTSSGVVVPPTRFTLFSQGQVLEVEAIGGSGVSGVGGVLPGADHAVSRRVCRLCATSCSGVSGIPGWAADARTGDGGEGSQNTRRGPVFTTGRLVPVSGDVPSASPCQAPQQVCAAQIRCTARTWLLPLRTRLTGPSTSTAPPLRQRGPNPLNTSRRSPGSTPTPASRQRQAHDHSVHRSVHGETGERHNRLLSDTHAMASVGRAAGTALASGETKRRAWGRMDSGQGLSLHFLPHNCLS